MAAFKGRMLMAKELVHYRLNRSKHMPTRPQKLITSCNPWLEKKQLETYIEGVKDVIAEERVEKVGSLAQAEWNEDMKIAQVTRRVGNCFTKFGYEEHMTVFLYPEEALFLLENNNLELLYNGVAMSIQQAYSVLLGTTTGCTFIEYLVFSHLERLGYKVLRHSTKRTATQYEIQIGLYAHRVNSHKKTKPIERKLRSRVNKAVSCDENKEKEKCVRVSIKNDESKIMSSGNQTSESTNCNLYIEGNVREIAESVPQVTKEENTDAAFESHMEQIGVDEKDVEQRSNCHTQCVLPETDKSVPRTEGDDAVFENDIEQIVVDENGVEQCNTVPQSVLAKIDASVQNVSKTECDDALFENDIVQIVVDENDVEVMSEPKIPPKSKPEKEDPHESSSDDSDCQVIYSRKEDKIVIEVNLSDSGSINSEDDSGSEASSGFECNDFQGIPIGDAATEETEKTVSMSKHEETDMVEVCGQGSIEETEKTVSMLKHKETDGHGQGRIEETEEASGILQNNEADGLEVSRQDSIEEIEEALSMLKHNETETLDTSYESSVSIESMSSSSSSSSGSEMSQAEIDRDLRMLAQGRINDVLKVDIANEVFQDGPNGNEIELIDLGDSDSNMSESREDILQSFPNFAGLSELNVDVPPARLLPSNISPIQQSYKLSLWKLKDPKFGGNPKPIEKNEGNYRNWGNNNWANNRQIQRGYMNSDNGAESESSTFLNLPEGFPVDDMPLDYPYYQLPSPSVVLQNWPSADEMRQRGQARSPGRGRCWSRGRSWDRGRGRGRVRARGGRGRFQRQRSPFKRRPREWSGESHLRTGNNWPVDSSSERGCSQDNSDHESFLALGRGGRSTLTFEGQEMSFSDFCYGNQQRNENDRPFLNSRKRPRFGSARYFAPTNKRKRLMSYLQLTESATGETSGEQSSLPERTPESSHVPHGVNECSVMDTTSSDGSKSSTSSDSSDTDESSSEDPSEENSFVDVTHSSESPTKITPLANAFKSDDISNLMQSLQIFKPANFSASEAEPYETPLPIKYDLYLPTTPFRKSRPSLPDFRVIIMHPEDHIPSSYNLKKIQRSVDDCVPLLIAVVSFDTICFYQYSSAKLSVEQGDVNSLCEKTGS